MTQEIPAEEYWKSIIDENQSLEGFNHHVVRFIKERGPVYVQMVATEAKRRGYVVEKVNGDKTGRYTRPLNMQLTKGRNIIRVDWYEGTLYAEFASSPKIYEYPNVPEVWFKNLLKSIYPDHLFSGYKAKLEAANRKGE